MTDQNINWNRLQEVYDEANKAGVAFYFHKSDADGRFYFVISSIAPSEDWIGKDKDFDGAVDAALDWLNKIQT